VSGGVLLRLYIIFFKKYYAIREDCANVYIGYVHSPKDDTSQNNITLHVQSTETSYGAFFKNETDPDKTNITSIEIKACLYMYIDAATCIVVCSSYGYTVYDNAEKQNGNRRDRYVLHCSVRPRDHGYFSLH
jgi:hypothetical protein